MAARDVTQFAPSEVLWTQVGELLDEHMFDSVRGMADDEHRDSPEYRKWEAENARRSAAMADAVRTVQGTPTEDDEAAEDEGGNP
jgi:hypothetical protein